MATSDQLQWLQRLQSFLNVFLQPIIKDQIERNQYIDALNMAIWARAFTHETMSPSDNYEDLEFLGDAMLKAVFPKYLMKRFPYLHKGEYTELNVAYMSGIPQAKLARSLGLGEYVRFKGIDRVNLNLEGDVFESFFGALDTISDMLVPGLGFANCYNMIVHLFRNIDIDETKGRGSAKTQVLQMFVRFDLPKPQEQTPGSEVLITATPSLMHELMKVGITDSAIGHSNAVKDKDAELEAYRQVINLLANSGLIIVEKEKITGHARRMVDFTVSLRKEHLDFLRSYGVDIKNPIIGYTEAPTKKEAEFEAYNQALNKLAENGITTEWAEEAKQVRDFSDPSVVPYVVAASDRLRKSNFQSMYFFIPRKTVTPKGAIVQLVGVRENGHHEVLSYTYATDRDNSYRTAKAEVVRQYALGK
jgi:dsRNA-specific ribonuclease